MTTPIVVLGRRLKTLAISCFICITFAAIFVCNLPNSTWDHCFAQLETSTTPEIAYRARLAHWGIKHYAHVIGVDNTWMMFGRQSRFNWSYIITAHYSDGVRSESRVLPLSRQSQRTSLERYVLDYKEAKFYLNIYNDQEAREAYAHYLARKFPTQNGLPIKSISVAMVTQPIVPPIIAVRDQKLHEPMQHYMLREIVDVSANQSSATGEKLTCSAK